MNYRMIAGTGSLIALCLAVSCGQSRNNDETSVLVSSDSSASPVPVYDTGRTAILKLYAGWQKEQMAKGAYWAKDSCTMDWFASHPEEDTKDTPYGFSNDSTWQVSYADLNGDGIRDGLIAFTPEQCDGGNGSMWTQEQVFILSGTDGYSLSDSLRVDEFAATDFDSTGFYWLDSIGTNRIYGMYFAFAADDGHCCPSTNKPVAFDYSQRKLVYMGDNQQQN